MSLIKSLLIIIIAFYAMFVFITFNFFWPYDFVIGFYDHFIHLLQSEGGRALIAMIVVSFAVIISTTRNP